MTPHREQLERVRRYYRRFGAVNDGVSHTVPSEERVDDVHAFFIMAYHLKDWLKNDSAFRKHTDQEVEEYVNNIPALALCADIANGLKHLKLIRPRSGDTPEFGAKQFALHLGGSRTISIKFGIEHKGKTIDAFQLASEILSAWESFIL